MATKPKSTKPIEELRRRSTAAEEGGGAERRKREHQAGKLGVRERIALLLDEGTFEDGLQKLASKTTSQGKL